MKRRILCKLGFHDYVSFVFIYGAWMECEHCGKIYRK